MKINKFKSFNVLWIILASIGCVCIITVGITWYRKAKLIDEWRSIHAELEEELKGLKLPPTTKSIFAVRREYEWLLEKQKEIEELLEAKRLGADKLSPLEFKEELINTETKLRQLASIQGCQIPKDIGFPEYTGGKIPETAEVDLLSKQLNVIKEITDILLKHKVENLIKIERLPYIYYSKDNLYKELSFKIEMQCILEDLLGVLADLPKTSFFTVVRKIRLDKADEKRVKAELLIGVVEFET